jgi:hypothetical protein
MPQLPAKPDYLRVKLWRRLQRIGAVSIKHAVWALPAGEAAMEDFQWLLREIEADGGEAVICEATFVAGITPAQAAALAGARAAPSPRTPDDAPTDASADAPGAVAAGAARGVARRAAPGDAAGGPESPRGRTWVTRRGVKVDRIASAWLVRRRIEPEARFKFVAPEGYAPAPGELRFDMYEAEYTHLGDSCTFEVLASTFAPEDAALAAIAEIVHDIDFKEPRYGRPETAGIAALIDGICAARPGDEARLERGFLLFDDLYALLRARG